VELDVGGNGVREAIEKGYLKLRIADKENPVA
jgi:hypothetical protein